MPAVRELVTKKQYRAYDAKKDSEISSLTDTQKKSFEIGTDAAKSYKNQFYGLFQWQAYKAPKAYYAGLQAGLEQDNELIQKITQKPTA